MHTHTVLSRPRSGVAAAAVLALLIAATPARAHDIIYYGRATAALGELTVGPSDYDLEIANVGMSCGGVPREENLSATATPSPLSLNADVVRSFTHGAEHVSRAETEMRTVLFEVPGLRISADGMGAEATATCEIDESVSIDGHAQLDGLRINDEIVTITGEPNQTIAIPEVGTVILNKQIRYSREIRVTAAHVTLANAADLAYGEIELAKARAKIKRCKM